MELTHVVVVLLLPVLLEGPEVLLAEGLLLDGEGVQAAGGLGAQLVEEVQQGGRVHLARRHADVRVHHLHEVDF